MKQSRNNQITRVSIVGIGANAVIAAFKVVVGLLSNSVAVLLDAINNVSDALSSAITIIGVKLAGRKPDSKHPFGYGRVEYFSAILVAGIIFAAGVSSMIESVKAIINPKPTSFTWVSVMVIVVAIVGKLILGRYFQIRGKALNSDALVASGLEASYDAVLSAATLLGAAVSMLWDINIDGYIGAVISAFIIKTGIETLLDPLGKVVGKKVEGDLATAIKSKVKEVPGVLGAYDLILHDYGSDKAIGSIHIEVSDTLPSHQIQKICRNVAALIYSEFKAVMTVGIYVMNDTNPEVIDMHEDIRQMAMSQDGVQQMHGFFVDEEEMAFDIVVSFDHDAPAISQWLEEQITKKYPGKKIHITIDTNYSG
ncbi:MAG: cation diffusion facilitator family transporter [Bacteroidaceae bacterium]|nr:cation diffusion facilitator family transporter [Bacteroidaceae bacterium]